MKIKLTDDQIDEVVLFELQRHSRLLESNVDSLKSKKKKDLRKFEREDLDRWKEVLGALHVLVGYYGS
jgi:hypothetical protein